MMASAPQLVLAPMEGLLDADLRVALTALGDYSYAISAFTRVSHTALNAPAFLRACPELQTGGVTPNGTPVAVQLLGSDADLMAKSVTHLLQQYGRSVAQIDLNFGCPSPTVNRHGGGAVLLDQPARIFAICRAVVQTVETARRDITQTIAAPITVSCKMRLGIGDHSAAKDAAAAMVAAGVSTISLHARSRDERYRPPAHWHKIGELRQTLPQHVTLIANGEIWSVHDAVRCVEQSGTPHLMMGRGAVADPFLAARWRLRQSDEPSPQQRDEEWRRLAPHIHQYWQRVSQRLAAPHAPGRLKLWLKHLTRNFPEAENWLTQVRPLTTCQNIDSFFLQKGFPPC